MIEVFKTELPTIDQIVFALKGMIPEVDDRKVVQAFYLSKMTIAEETEMANSEYTFLRWPEFLEFIPRLAYMRHRGTYKHEEWRLERKIKDLLDILLRLVGETRIDPPELS